MTSPDDDKRAQLDRSPDQIAQATGGTPHSYPGTGAAARSAVLRDIHDDKGSQYETAELDDDGTLRVTGYDQGHGVTEFFGDNITSYEWDYVIAPDKIRTLIQLLGGEDGDDVLALLTAYHQQTQGQIYGLLTSPDVSAQFSNWHS